MNTKAGVGIVVTDIAATKSCSENGILPTLSKCCSQNSKLFPLVHCWRISDFASSYTPRVDWSQILPQIYQSPGIQESFSSSLSLLAPPPDLSRTPVFFLLHRPYGPLRPNLQTYRLPYLFPVLSAAEFFTILPDKQGSFKSASRAVLSREGEREKNLFWTTRHDNGRLFLGLVNGDIY